MNELEKAIIFAVNAHEGAYRKNGKTPYILHPMEVASIAGTMTDEIEVLAAAVLHDTVEDTAVTPEEIEKNFGKRVAELVSSETENKRKDLPSAESWQIRKIESLEKMKAAEDINVKILWLSDKLSNVRSIYRLQMEKGADLWRIFNQKDPAKQAWYYRTVAEYTGILSHTEAWREYDALVTKIFQEKNNNDGSNLQQ